MIPQSHVSTAGFTTALFAGPKTRGRPFATTWMKLEGLRLSELSQTTEDKCWRIPLMQRIFKKSKLGTKSRPQLPRASGCGKPKMVTGHPLSVPEG